jgi:Carboxypeptidase regulatory-like domain
MGRSWASAPRPARLSALVYASSLLLATACPAFAQFDRGAISGTVRDQLGGVVPDAAVTASNTQVGKAHTTVADPSGFYTFPSLQPGLYDLAAELRGFKKVTHRAIQLDAAAAITLDFRLEAGVVTEEVVVVAETQRLQTDVAVRKTVESKDIELLLLNGRNPINLALLKSGVRGGPFNIFNFDSLTTGGFSINGSRSDDNLITVDGAIATRTRAAGAIIGVLNVDVLQEVQILTTNYMPEFGRSSGGQIRMVTKSGGREFRGSLYEYFRSDALDANAWSRNRSPDPRQYGGPAPFSFNQWGGTVGGPVVIPGRFNTNRDKLFFFWGEEWTRYRQTLTAPVPVPSDAMRRGDFSELLDPANQYFGRVRQVIDPETGRPFLNNVIPASRLSPNGTALLSMYPQPTPGFRQGQANAILDSDNPRDTRKDHVRVDWSLNSRNQVTGRWSKFNWEAIDAFRGGLTLARGEWSRPNTTSSFAWTSTLSSTLINELTFGYSRDRVVINPLGGTDTHQRSRYRIAYPFIFPTGKEIEDKIPTVVVPNFQIIDGGAFPQFSQGPIYTWSDNVMWVSGRHTFKAGAFIEYSGEDNFDQSPVNQTGHFEFTDDRVGGTGLAVANAALGLFTTYREIGQRARTTWRALATDLFVQDSWKPASHVTVEGGIRWSYWPPWHALLNNGASFDPRFYDPTREVAIQPRTGFVIPNTGDRYNGIVLPGNGFPPEALASIQVAQDPAVQALFRGVPRGFSQTHADVIEPRLGFSWQWRDKTIVRASGGIFHTRVTLNDSTLLGANAPFQPQVQVSNGSADHPGGATLNDHTLVMTAQDPVFDHPTAYTWAAGIQRELPFGIVADVTYVGRRGVHLQRERNINQLAPGTVDANPGVNPDALRPFRGFSVIRLSENAGKSRYNGLQLSLDRRYRDGFKIGVAYTLSRLTSNADDKRDILPNTFDDALYEGISRLDRTHVLNVHYIYELPFWRHQTTLLRRLVGGWQVSGVIFLQSGEPYSVFRNNYDGAAVGDTFPKPYDLIGDPTIGHPRFSQGAGIDQHYWFNPAAFREPQRGTFGRQPRGTIRGPGFQSWDITLVKTTPLKGTRRLS